MTGALIILAALIVVGLALYIHHRLHPRPADEPASDEPVEDGECCGRHAVCEKTSLLVTDDRVVYFDDEELDRFAGRAPESYTADEEEEMREVLLTLRAEDVAPWARSLSLRNIALPSALRDELLLIVSESRQQSVNESI